MSSPKLPKNFPLTPYRKGFKKWINGKSRHVCGHLTPREALARYHERLKAGDFDDRPAAGAAWVVPDEGLSLKQVANRYVAHMRECVEDTSGRKRPMSLRHYADTVKALQLFSDVVCGQEDPPAIALGPAHFSIYVAAIPGLSPTTHNRYVSAVTAMYRYAVKNQLISRPVAFGSDMERASQARLRERRDEVEYAFTVPEVRTLLQAATPQVRAFMLLGLNCAFTNIDVGRLRWRHVDFDNNLIRLGRLKRGLSARKCPMWPETRAALVAAFASSRHATSKDPADGDRVFLTMFGLPFAASYERRNADGVLVGDRRHDSVRLSWSATKRAAGFFVLDEDGRERFDGRGFKGLRTTFRTGSREAGTGSGGAAFFDLARCCTEGRSVISVLCLRQSTAAEEYPTKLDAKQECAAVNTTLDFHTSELPVVVVIRDKSGREVIYQLVPASRKLGASLQKLPTAITNALATRQQRCPTK